MFVYVEKATCSEFRYNKSDFFQQIIRRNLFRNLKRIMALYAIYDSNIKIFYFWLIFVYSFVIILRNKSFSEYRNDNIKQKQTPMTEASKIFNDNFLIVLCVCARCFSHSLLLNKRVPISGRSYWHDLLVLLHSMALGWSIYKFQLYVL